MPSISELGEVPPPVEAISWDRREFPSPDAEWRLVFHGPFEWHMGATGWELALSRNGKADREAETRLSEIGKGKGFRCPPDTVPWSHLGDTLALITWEDPAVLLFEVAKTSVRRVLSPGFPFSVKWASDRDLLLLPYDDRGELIGPNGAVLVKTDWTLAEYEHPHVFWTEPAEHFLLVSRPSRRSMTRLTLFSSVDGREETSFAIDPADLLKYDHKRYEAVHRDRYSLVINSSTRSVGSLLDVWHSTRFDAKTGVMRLATYRPVGEPYLDKNELLCQVEEVWCAIQIAA